MSKTKQISIETSDEVRVTNSRNKTIIHVDAPDIQELLKEIDSEDIVSFIQWDGYDPDEVFEEEQLHKWASENGYIKE